MKSIAKNNFITILSKIRDNFKDLSSIFTENYLQSSDEVPLISFRESNPDIIDELLESSAKLDKKAKEYVLNIGVPSKIKKTVNKTKISKETTPVKSTIINPIIDKSISNERNISLMNNGFERD